MCYQSMKALVIGRFQPFHNGHLHLLQNLCTQYDQVVIGIGSSQYSYTMDNPFSFEERVRMIQESLTEVMKKKIIIYSIPDIHDLSRWVDHVVNIVGGFDVVISNNQLTIKLFSKKGYPVCSTPLYHKEKYAGTQIRRQILHNSSWKKLVPTPVARIIEEIQGVNRIQHLV